MTNPIEQPRIGIVAFEYLFNLPTGTIVALFTPQIIAISFLIAAVILGRNLRFPLKRVFDPLKGLACTLFGLLVHPFVCLLCAVAVWHWRMPALAALCFPCIAATVAVLCAKWDSTNDANGIRRGDLPDWAGVFGTPDERLPGDVVGEPTVRKVWERYGKTACSLFWLLHRNRAIGLSFEWCREVDAYLNGELWGFQELPSGAWRYVKRLGPLQFGCGNQTTALKGKIYAVPWCTVKTVHGDKP